MILDYVFVFLQLLVIFISVHDKVFLRLRSFIESLAIKLTPNCDTGLYVENSFYVKRRIVDTIAFCF